MIAIFLKMLLIVLIVAGRWHKPRDGRSGTNRSSNRRSWPLDPAYDGTDGGYHHHDGGHSGHSGDSGFGDSGGGGDGGGGDGDGGGGH